MPRKQSNSISSRSKRVAESGFLDLIGSDSMDYQPATFDNVAQALYDVALEFITIAKNNLEKADKVSTGDLSDSIIPLEVQINGKIYSLQISVASYYDFVNKGVKGWEKGGGNSPYQFKKPGKRGSGNKQSKFVSSIRKWIIREGLQTNAKEVGHSSSTKRDSNRKRKAKFTDTSTRTAIIIASQIRRRGLEPTHFWDDSISSLTDIMKAKFSNALKADVITNLTTYK